MKIDRRQLLVLNHLKTSQVCVHGLIKICNSQGKVATRAFLLRIGHKLCMLLGQGEVIHWKVAVTLQLNEC